MNDHLEQARKFGTPIIEGETVTFLWSGKEAPALIGDFSGWEHVPLQIAQSGTQLWLHQVQLPRDAYIEYAFLDPVSGKRQPDPFNRRSIANGLGDFNHFFYMPEAVSTPLIRRERGISKGKISRHQVATGDLAAGKVRRAYLYQPAVDEPCPLLVVLDGNDYLARGKLPHIIDNLIAQGRIKPLAMALVAHGGQARPLEYLCNDATLGFISEQILPLARRELNLDDPRADPGCFGIMGASMGGLMALYAGLRMPDIFGNVLAQSGFYSYGDQDFAVKDMIRYGPHQPINIWMDAGKFEHLLGSNQRMHALLVDRRYQVCYREYPGGHNYTSWRNDLWRGLEYLYPVEGD